MRTVLVLFATTALAACGGGGTGPTAVGGSAAPTAPPTGGTPTAPGSGHTFVNPTEQKTYAAIGGVQHYRYSTNEETGYQFNQLYAGDASTARNSGITVNYNPRDAIFEIVLDQPLANVNQTRRFQDPAHRTDFGGATEPQEGVPNIAGRGIQYLETGTGEGVLQYDLTQSDTFPIGTSGAKSEAVSFFYQRPGTTTSYVTYAGFVRNQTQIVTVTAGGATFLRQDHQLDRGAFVFGERTGSSAIPNTGTGTFDGQMLASMVFNPLFDTDATAPTYYQWITGNSRTSVNFAANTFSIDLTGTVMAPQFDIYTSRVFTLQPGASFTAAGTGRVDITNAGGFLGQINSAFFVQPNGTRLDLNIAGSSVDGAFFGPRAEEVGGGFRIVGGTPDERIDIMGAFTGKR